MKSKKLRKLIASVAMLAMTAGVFGGGASALAVTIPEFEKGWAVNLDSRVTTISGQGVQLTTGATKTEETIMTVDKIETEVLTTDTIVNVNINGTNTSRTYKATDSEGGVARVGVRLGGKLESYLRSYVTDAVSEYRDNVNTVNANRHNNGTSIKPEKQVALGERLYAALWGKNSSGNWLNESVRFIVTYELSDGRTRTTSVGLSDITLDMPVTDPASISSASDLRSLVDENGLVYLTLRGLPSDVTITNVELDSRSDLHAVTNAAGSEYSVQKTLNYTAGRVSIPASTWVLTDSLYPSVIVNGKSEKQFLDAGTSNVIEKDEHFFVDVAGTTVTLVDILKDTDKVVTGVTFTDRRGNTYNGEVGDFAEGKYRETQNGTAYNINYGTRYRDIKIAGLNTRTNYEFEYMDITYKSGDGERTQRVRFDNKVATGEVTGNKYLSVTTSDYATSQIYAYRSLINGASSLYQVNVGRNSLEYLVKVDDTTNLDRLEVRGLRGGETYTVENVKSEDGKKDKSNWFAVKITGLEENRDYSFLSLETVYNENGRERYGTPISLGRSSDNRYDNVLFPGDNITSSNNRYNMFATTNNGNVSELWIDSQLKHESVPGGVKFYGIVKDADDILDKVNVYINNGGSYERIDDSNVKLEKTYRIVKGIDIDSNGTLDSTNKTITYPYVSSGNNTISISENSVESASEMVEITITGISSDRSRDFRFDFTTKQDGNRVSSIRTGDIGAFGSIPADNTKTQQTVTRYASGRAGTTKVQVNTSNVQVSGVTTTTANVTAGITNPDKEAINVEVAGATGVTAKYNTEKNIIELSGLRAGTEYKDLKLTLKYGDKSTTITVPAFTTTTTTQVEVGVAGYVARVYRTFFNREADQAGLLYWTERLAGGEETLSGFLRQLSFTPELIEKNLTNTQFVERMYAIVDRTGEAEGVAFWVSEIEKGIKEGNTQSQARAAVVERMLDTDEVKGIATKLGIKF